MSLIDPALLQTRLAAAGRFDVDALVECDSTNSELIRRAERGAPAGSVLVADRQSAGRGRRGRSWLSSPESSLTFSVLWRFPGPMSPARAAMRARLVRFGALRAGLFLLGGGLMMAGFEAAPALPAAGVLLFGVALVRALATAGGGRA